MSVPPGARAFTDHFVEATDQTSGRPLQIRYYADRVEFIVKDGADDRVCSVKLADLRYAIAELAAPAWQRLATTEREKP